MALLEINNLHVKLGSFQLEHITLDIDAADYFVLLGPSGSGKSILLETIAGLIKPQSGTIFCNNKDITHQKIRQRNIGLMFQDNTAFSHLSAGRNIEFALRLKYKNKEVISKKLRQLSDKLEINHLLSRHTNTLSGGELQRILLARTLASEPALLMLDEPMSSVDSVQKDELKTLLRNINRNGLPVLHVTHDFEEAISLAGKLGVMHNGKLIAQGSPEQILRKPSNEFMARFTGHKNFYRVDFPAPDLAKINEQVSVRIPHQWVQSDTGYISIEPRQIILSDGFFPSSAQNTMKGLVTDVAPCRDGFEIKLDISTTIIALITSESMQKMKIEVGQEYWLNFKSNGVQVIV